MAGKTKRSKVAKAKLCGLNGCKNKVHSRGRCQTDLRGVWDRIDRGEFTESEAVELGLLEPRERTGRPRSSRVEKALKKLESREAGA